MEQPKNNFKIVSNKKTRMILPNAITLIGVCIGLTSIKFAIDGKFVIAIIAILFAGLMDALDGRIARLIKGTSKMGKELDSLGDVISFGVAPALIMYFWNLQYLDKLGWFVCLTYLFINIIAPFALGLNHFLGYNINGDPANYFYVIELPKVDTIFLNYAAQYPSPEYILYIQPVFIIYFLVLYIPFGIYNKFKKS